MYLIFVVGEFYLCSCQLSIFLVFASLTSGENLNGASLFNISISLINGLNLKKKISHLFFFCELAFVLESSGEGF